MRGVVGVVDGVEDFEVVLGTVLGAFDFPESPFQAREGLADDVDILDEENDGADGEVELKTQIEDVGEDAPEPDGEKDFGEDEFVLDLVVLIV